MSRSTRGGGFFSDARSHIRGSFARHGAGRDFHNNRSSIPIRQGIRKPTGGSSIASHASRSNIINAIARQYPVMIQHNRRQDARGSSLELEKWHKWTVLYGVRYERPWLFQKIQEKIAPFQLKPFNIKNDQRNVVFNVQLTRSRFLQVREQLKGTTDENGREIIIDISSRSDNEPELPDFNDEFVKEKVNAALQKRFHAQTNSLDLSSFHNDQALIDNGLHINLNKGSVIDLVCETLLKNLGSLFELNLSSNNLRRLDGFKSLFNQFTMLKKVDLSNNPLTDTSVLTPLQPCKHSLIELNLSQTHLHLKLKRFLLSEINKLFPNVIVVDPGESQPNVLFEIQKVQEKVKQLPTSIPFFFDKEDGSGTQRTGIMRFIVDYLKQFDSNRRGLIEYYTPSSVLTLHCGLHSLLPEDCKRIDKIMFQNHNRNLIQVKDYERRKAAIKTGDLQIVACLDSFPRSEHHCADDGTFTVEVTLQTDNFILLQFNCLYNEFSSNRNTLNNSEAKILRAVNHVMLIVPPLKIVNHDIMVTNPTRQMINKMNAGMSSSTTASTSSGGGGGSINVVSSSNPSDPSEATQLSLVHQLMQASGMNVDYSRKCLHEFNWNYREALETVLDMRNRGQLPSDAF